MPDDTRLRLMVLQPQVTYFEDQLSRGIAPSIDRIIHVRSQLLQLLDEQYRKPQSERDSSIEPLLTRVFNIYTRADQLRVMQATLPSSLRPNPVNISPGVESSRIPRYLLSSPDGYQGIITSPGTTESLQATLEALRAARASQTAFTPNHGHHPAEAAHPNPNAVVMENAVRQAVLNQRAGANNGGLGIARSIRRLWLFVRLYFFCYMFSEPGTWTRFLFVSLAVLAALLSETGHPQRLYRMLVAPVQQHLEGLVHFAPGTEPPAETNNTNQPAGARDGRGGLAAELRHNLRRVERSLALFIASLVPGVGERHVEVRHAAEAARNAERTREEEDRRRREEEAANAAQDPQQPDSERRNDEPNASAPQSGPEPEPVQQSPASEQPRDTALQGDETRAA